MPAKGGNLPDLIAGVALNSHERGSDDRHRNTRERARGPGGWRTGALEDLRAEVRGAVLEPADPGQQDVRAVFNNAMHPSNPALTVRCSGTADERVRFEAHLAECDGCAGYLEDTRRLAASLHEVSEPPADPATREALLRAFRDLRPDSDR